MVEVVGVEIGLVKLEDERFSEVTEGIRHGFFDLRFAGSGNERRDMVEINDTKPRHL